jgi:flavin reductase (DIM6/NTAB) family NADH-FMN oxidoreductase RutF
LTIDIREYRRTIGLFATGVTVITAGVGEQIHGMTANSLTSVSLDPLLLLVCVDRRARMCAVIHEAGRFAVNILAAEQEPLSRHFAGRAVEGLDIAFDDLNGVPVLSGALATLSCTVSEILEGGDHIIVMGAVEAFERRAEPPPPLLYYSGGYHRIA